MLTGSLPQARATDRMLCIPPIPTGSDVIVTGAFNVLVGSLPAARMFDLTLKPGIVTKGQPNVLIGMMGLTFPTLMMSFGLMITSLVMTIWDDLPDDDDFEIELFKNDWLKIGSIKWSSDAKFDGPFDWSFSGKLEFVWVELDGVGTMDLPLIGPVGAAGKYQAVPGILSLDAGSSGKGEYDVGGQALIAAAKAQGSVFHGSDPNNPNVEIGVAGNFLHAEAAGHATQGEGGKTTGVALRGKAAAEVVSGDIFSEQNIDTGDGNSISMREKVSGSLITAGGEVGGWAENDHETGRNHVGGVGEVKAGGGIGLAGDVSYGPKYKNRDGRKI